MTKNKKYDKLLLSWHLIEIIATRILLPAITLLCEKERTFNRINEIISKFKEVSLSILPVTAIVSILHFTLTPLAIPLIVRFFIGVLLIILGLTLFLFGVDVGITPIGNHMGSAIARTNRIWVVITAGLILGFFISIAEPDLHILAEQVDSVTSGLISKTGIVAVVSVGIAVMLSFGLIRIVMNLPLYKVLAVIYAIIFLFALFTSREFLAISFDASGSTTGALTVPFILALAMGVSKLKKDSKASEKDSFGLVAIASAGAILSVMIMSILSNNDTLTGHLEHPETSLSSIWNPFIETFPVMAKEVFLALFPILLLFLLFKKFYLKISAKAFRKILSGIILTFAGLVMFLAGVNAGFMDVGSLIGYKVASLENKAFLVIIGFFLGLSTILAEPAVYVLTHQIEDVTSGYVKRKIVLLTLSIGVGLAVALSMVRILIPEVQLWHYLLPGYALCIIMSFFTPKLFVGMAFDSGGVASGPMTATFVLAFAQGAAEAAEGATVMVDGFGMIAMVALMPIIALQILGLVFKIKSRKKGLQKNEQ